MGKPIYGVRVETQSYKIDTIEDAINYGINRLKKPDRLNIRVNPVVNQMIDRLIIYSKHNYLSGPRSQSDIVSTAIAELYKKTFKGS